MKAILFIPLALSLLCGELVGSDRFLPRPDKDGKLNKLTQFPDSAPLETATFAGGCFWGVESVFRQVYGVQSTKAGYSGGKVKKPTYQQVSLGKTGHAEAVQLVFNPDVVSYGQLLEVFFKSHDPTQLNRQGPDVGTQYRSAIFVHSKAQAKAAQEKIREMTKAGRFKKPIVTQVQSYRAFYPASAKHQRYFEKMAKRRLGQ